MKTINKWRDEIHSNAKAHGWWDEERTTAEVAMLCVTELAEAVEEDRKGNPLVYEENGKPEGIAVEMIDCLIRILDWCGQQEIDVEKILRQKHEFNKSRPYKHGKRY